MQFPLSSLSRSVTVLATRQPWCSEEVRGCCWSMSGAEGKRKAAAMPATQSTDQVVES